MVHRQEITLKADVTLSTRYSRTDSYFLAASRHHTAWAASLRNSPSFATCLKPHPSPQPAQRVIRLRSLIRPPPLPHLKYYTRIAKSQLLDAHNGRLNPPLRLDNLLFLLY